MKILVTLMLLLSGAVSTLQAQVPDLIDRKQDLVNATVRPLEILIEAGTTQSRTQTGSQPISHPIEAETTRKSGALVRTSIKVTLLPKDPEQPPPPKQNPEVTEKIMTTLVNEMAEVLNRLETLIRARGVLLLLVFDLDDTLFQRSFQFGPEIESLTLSQLKELQQLWLMQFHDFLNNNPDSVRLVYNTSRNFMSLPSKEPIGQEHESVQLIRTVDGVTRRMMQFLTQEESSSLSASKWVSPFLMH
ncbi:MAG: hypothetical protein ACR2PX_04075 [Endozoicomonas sp.]|uniref:hypothetical protein n=1 Tax=Endozoicomonas sp. TaxID=1892382 RepID=UPI003D9B6FA7